MTPEETELAKRLAAHPEWEWRPGMRIFTPEPCRLFSPDDYAALCPSPNLDDNEVGIILGGDVSVAKGCHWPDLSDPATQGVVLAMIAEVAPDLVVMNGHYIAPWMAETFGASLAKTWLHFQEAHHG